MKFNSILNVLISLAMLHSVITPVFADPLSLSENKSENTYSTLLIDHSSAYIPEIRNDKVILYESLKSGKAQQTTPLNKILSISFQTQQNDYYCGPAAVRMLLAATGKYYTQDYIAGQIGTTVNGTGFGASFINPINSLSSGTGFSFNLVWGASDLKNRSVIAIVYGNPVLVNTNESAAGYHLKGHAENGIQYHCGIVNGYRQSGNILVYTDPAYGRFPYTVQQQDVSLDIMSSMVSTLGFIW